VRSNGCVLGRSLCVALVLRAQSVCDALQLELFSSAVASKGVGGRGAGRRRAQQRGAAGQESPQHHASSPPHTHHTLSYPTTDRRRSRRRWALEPCSPPHTARERKNQKTKTHRSRTRPLLVSFSRSDARRLLRALLDLLPADPGDDEHARDAPADSLSCPRWRATGMEEVRETERQDFTRRRVVTQPQGSGSLHPSPLCARGSRVTRPLANCRDQDRLGAIPGSSVFARAEERNKSPLARDARPHPITRAQSGAD
jgi:hypothetical protein